MAKAALLVGVSEYGQGLVPLAKAVRDIEAMQRVLEHPEKGGFDEVTVLPNPDAQTMREAIDALFSNRAKEDLVLFYFSGHGVKDDNNLLYLTATKSRKSVNGQLVTSTAIPSRDIHFFMENSASRRKIIILDCCFSGAFPIGMSAKDDGSVDIKTPLGGEGRVVLTSSTSTQYSFEDEKSDNSIYTRFLVEGIETGAANQDNDDMIGVVELHEYAKKRVQEAAPAMKPEIYPFKEGHTILLARAVQNDPKLRYRKEVEKLAQQGDISYVGRAILDKLQSQLMLQSAETAAIEAEVLKPALEHKQNLADYGNVFAKALERGYPFAAHIQEELKRLQKISGLRDEDVAPVESSAITAWQAQQTHPMVETPTVSTLPLPLGEVTTPVPPIVPPATLVLSQIKKNGKLAGILAASMVVCIALYFGWLNFSHPNHPSKGNTTDTVIKVLVDTFLKGRRALPPPPPTLKEQQDLSDKRLKLLGTAVLAYIKDHDNKFPPLAEISEAQNALRPYGVTPETFLLPGTMKAYLYNSYLVYDKDANSSIKTRHQDTPLYNEPEPLGNKDSALLHGVLLDGSVAIYHKKWWENPSTKPY